MYPEPQTIDGPNCYSNVPKLWGNVKLTLYARWEVLQRQKKGLSFCMSKVPTSINREMFQNVLMTVTPLSEVKDEIDCWENRPFMHSWPKSTQQKIYKDTVNKTIKKKSKRNRTAYTTDQLRVLEKTFARTKYVDAERRKELANNLKIGEKCVKVWFQNRRMKEKKECFESSNDSSSECVAYEPVTPPQANSIQCNSENQYVHQNNGYFEQTVHIDNTIEPQPYCYPYEENYEAFYRSHGVGYQNCASVDYARCAMPTHINDYFRNDSTVYPAQYYPCSTVPENMYTNMENNQHIQQQQSTVKFESLYW